jgi:hypothetical protein
LSTDDFVGIAGLLFNNGVELVGVNVKVSNTSLMTVRAIEQNAAT